VSAKSFSTRLNCASNVSHIFDLFAYARPPLFPAKTSSKQLKFRNLKPKLNHHSKSFSSTNTLKPLKTLKPLRLQKLRLQQHNCSVYSKATLSDSNKSLTSLLRRGTFLLMLSTASKQLYHFSYPLPSLDASLYPACQTEGRREKRVEKSG
jgi:hypothetical protein